MSKIIAVINTMISNSKKMSQIISTQSEYFFLYDKKHKWSITKDDNNIYYLHYYPGKQTIEELSSIVDWSDFENFVTYSSKELKTREAYESMQELYRIVKEKVYGIDEAFDDIINSDEGF